MKAFAMLTVLIATLQFSQASVAADFTCRAQAADAIALTLVAASGASESSSLQVRSLELLNAGAGAQGEWTETYLAQVNREGFLSSYLVTLNADCEVTGFEGARSFGVKSSLFAAKGVASFDNSGPSDSDSPDSAADEFGGDSSSDSSVDSYDTPSSGSCETYEPGCSRGGSDSDSPDSTNSGDDYF